MNPAALSKINWTNGIAFLVAVAAVFGVVIPEAQQELALKVVATVVPVLTIVFRTFFTKKAD